ncbi:MAG: hypothetical protein GXY74_01125 [Phycisphaerae bacterium]|nr:hypothetical protein [Phycisphaerae bacterium]
MPAQRKATKGTLQGLIGAMGSCEPATCASFAGAVSEVGQEMCVAVSCAMVCSIHPSVPVDASAYETPLDLLASSACPDATDALLHIAEHARNGRVRVAAMMRLGKRKQDKRTRAFLYQVAKEGGQTLTGFRGEPITSDMMQVAALEGMSCMQPPQAADCQAALMAIDEEIEGGDDSPIFKAGVAAAAATCRPSNLESVIDAAKRCKNHLMGLRLLAACSKLDQKHLAAKAAPIGDFLLQALHQYVDESQLNGRLCELARKCVTPSLAKGLAERFGADCLDHGRGLVVASALEARGRVDDALVHTYLSCVRHSANIQPNGRCVRGLSRCASAGNAPEIVNQVVRQDSDGYRRLLRSDMLLGIVGDVPRVVDLLCGALDCQKTANERSALSPGCCECIVRISLANVENAPVRFELLEQQRAAPRRGYGGNRDLIPRLAEELQKCTGSCDGLGLLAKRVCAEGPHNGASAIAEQMLNPCDDLAWAFLDRVLASATTIRLKRPISSAQDSPLADIESLLTKDFEPHLRDQLQLHVVIGCTLNRFVLDLMRRRGVAFTKTAELALQKAEAVEDATFILDSLVAAHDTGSMRLLAQQIAHQPMIATHASAIRKKAIALFAALADDSALALGTDLRVAVLGRLHDRFQDSTEVRLAAYEACGRLADPSSIVPLKGRLATDHNPACKAAVKSALGSLRQAHLSRRPPPHAASESVVNWLGSLADLGDGNLMKEAAAFLNPPHADSRVLASALECLGRLQCQEAIPVIDAFMSDTASFGDVFLAARHAKATLQRRQDMRLLDVLSSVFPSDSPVLDLDLRYDELLGTARTSVIGNALADAEQRWNSSDWGVYITKVDAVCEVLVRHLFESCWRRMGLDQPKAKQLATKEYANRLHVSEFRDGFPLLQPLLLSIHNMRAEADVAHIEDNDGTGKVGVGEEQAYLVREQFKTAFSQCVEVLCQQDGGPDA